MIWAIAKAALSGLSGAFAKLLDLIKRYPWQVALAAALAGVWWQGQRAEKWQDRAETEASNHRKTKTAFKAANDGWRKEVARAKTERDQAILKGKETAAHAQETVERLRADDAGLRAHIARGRLPSRPAAEATPAAGGDHDPAVPADATADALVATTESDLRVCDDLYVYATGAYRFADELRASGLALPAPEFGHDAGE